MANPKDWWNGLERSERTLLLGITGGTLAAGALTWFAGRTVGVHLDEFTIRMDTPTRNLVSATTTDWTRSIDNLVAQGVPVYMKLGKRPEIDPEDLT